MSQISVRMGVLLNLLKLDIVLSYSSIVLSLTAKRNKNHNHDLHYVCDIVNVGIRIRNRMSEIKA